MTTHVLAGLAVGLALATAPGPVQAILLSESVRGGIARGFRAMAGASLTFGALLIGLALGVSVAPPSGPALRILEVTGGGLLLWLALDAVRQHSSDQHEPSTSRRTLPPAARGALAVLLNPGGWVFLGTVASSLMSGATRSGGTWSAVLVALGLIAGLAMGDGTVVMLGGIGVRKADGRVQLMIRRILAVLLAGIGLWLVVDGLAL